MNWTKFGRISLVIFAVIAVALTFLPKNLSPTQYCLANPSDITKCDCIQTMKWHIRVYDEFNITEQDYWNELISGKYQEIYNTTQVLEIYGNKTGFLKIKNLTKDYYISYNWEEVNETCKAAKPKLTEKRQQKIGECKSGCMEEASSCGKTSPTTTANNSCQAEFEKCLNKCEGKK